MAKKSKIARDRQRRQIVARYAERRAELKRRSISPGLGEDERVAARLELQRQPRNASATRVRNRDVVDGRPRGHLSTFGSPGCVSERWRTGGELPGITKSSW